MAGANRNEGRLFCQRVDPTGSNACFRYLLITVCRSEQQANRSISHGERSERCRAPSVCFATFVGLPSLRNVCLSVCDSQRRAHQHHAISSERRWISARVQCCGCNLPLRSCVMRSLCLAAGLLHRVVLAFLRGWSQLCGTHARSAWLSACDSDQLVERFCRTVCLSASDLGRLVATFACLRLGSRALFEA